MAGRGYAPSCLGRKAGGTGAATVVLLLRTNRVAKTAPVPRSILDILRGEYSPPDATVCPTTPQLGLRAGPIIPGGTGHATIDAKDA